MQLHELKSLPHLFDGVLLEGKTFEYRRNDRNFYPGHKLLLREYDPLHSNDPYTGRCIEALVVGVYGEGWEAIPDLPENFVIMQIKVLNCFVQKKEIK
jgi:hypothetical protein